MSIKMSDKQITLLCKLYEEQHLAVDRLPYTEEIDAMVEAFRTAFTKREWTHHDVYAALVYLRKQGTLPRKTDNKRKRELPRPIHGFSF